MDEGVRRCRDLAFDAAAYAAAKKYVDDTANGLGAVKGSPCTIKSTTESEEVSTIVFAWTGADGVERTETTFLRRGPQGEPGTGSVEVDTTLTQAGKAADAKYTGDRLATLSEKKTEGRSDGTLKNYARVLQAFFCWCRKQPEEVTANDIRIFLYEYQNSHRITERTLDKYREMICWFFHWAFNEEYIPRNPARSVKAMQNRRFGIPVCLRQEATWQADQRCNRKNHS